MAKNRSPLKNFIQIASLSFLVVALFAFAVRSTSDKSFDIRNKAATNPIYWGARMDGEVYGSSGDAPWDDTTWATFESHAGKKASIVHWGSSYPQTFAYNANVFAKVKSRGALTLLSYDTYNLKLRNIANGMYDTFFTQYAKDAAASKIPFFFRLDWEMNINAFYWSTVGGASNVLGNTPVDYVDMWRHLHNIFVANGATNVTWVWCPNQLPGQVALSSLYPGDAYVDWTCFDSYNWGQYHNAWLTFYQITKSTYDALLALAPSKPIMMAETGSVEQTPPPGSSKAAWITDALLSQLPINFPNIKAFVWFNWNYVKNNIRYDWPIESSTAAQNAFKNGITSSYYLAGSAALQEVSGPIKPYVLPTPTPTLAPNSLSCKIISSPASPVAGNNVSLTITAYSPSSLYTVKTIYLNGQTPVYPYGFMYFKGFSNPSTTITYTIDGNSGSIMGFLNNIAKGAYSFDCGVSTGGSVGSPFCNLYNVPAISCGSQSKISFTVN